MLNTRRKFIAALAALAAAPGLAQVTPSINPQPKATAVLLHGGWGGATYLKPIESSLRSKGFEVYRPSLVGTGETAHLAHADIGLDTHIRQIVNLIEYEDLRDVILAGYSYSGMVVSGVVDRIPQRIRLVVYIDAFLPDDGESAYDLVDANLARSPSLRAFDQEISKAPRIAGMIPAFWQKPDRKPPMQDPQPEKPLRERLALKNANARQVPGAFIQFVERGEKPENSDFSNSADRARRRGWPVRVIDGSHSAIGEQGARVADAIAEFTSGLPARQ